MKIERMKEFFTLFAFFLCNTSTELLVISFVNTLVINYFNLLCSPDDLIFQGHFIHSWTEIQTYKTENPTGTLRASIKTRIIILKTFL